MTRSKMNSPLKLEDDYIGFAHNAVRRKSLVGEDEENPDKVVCPICSQEQLFPDTEAVCVDCEKAVCKNCGEYSTSLVTKLQEWVCHLCIKRRRLVLSTGIWYHGYRPGQDMPGLQGIPVPEVDKEQAEKGAEELLERSSSMEGFEPSTADVEKGQKDEFKRQSSLPVSVETSASEFVLRLDDLPLDVIDEAVTMESARKDLVIEDDVHKTTVKAKSCEQVASTGLKASSGATKSDSEDFSDVTSDVEMEDMSCVRTRGDGSSTTYDDVSDDISQMSMSSSITEEIDEIYRLDRKRPRPRYLDLSHSTSAASSDDELDSLENINKLMGIDSIPGAIMEQSEFSLDSVSSDQDEYCDLSAHPAIAPLHHRGYSAKVDVDKAANGAGRVVSPSPPRSPSWREGLESPPFSPRRRDSYPGRRRSLSPPLSPKEKRHPFVFADISPPSRQLSLDEIYGDSIGRDYEGAHGVNIPQRPSPMSPEEMESFKSTSGDILHLDKPFKDGVHRNRFEIGELRRTDHECDLAIAVDLASFAATVASNTASLTSMTVSPTNLGILTDLGCQSSDPQLSPESVTSTDSTSSPGTYDDAQYSDEGDDVELADPSTKGIDYQGTKRQKARPPTADWSPVVDLSPILDVSPSIEEAEQEQMLAEQQRLYNEGYSDEDNGNGSDEVTSEESVSPDAKMNVLNPGQDESVSIGPLKRYNNIEDISQLINEANQLETRSSSDEDINGDVPMFSTFVGNVDVSELCMTSNIDTIPNSTPTYSRSAFNDTRHIALPRDMDVIYERDECSNSDNTPPDNNNKSNYVVSNSGNFKDDRRQDSAYCSGDSPTPPRVRRKLPDPTPEILATQRNSVPAKSSTISAWLSSTLSRFSGLANNARSSDNGVNGDKVQDNGPCAKSKLNSFSDESGFSKHDSPLPPLPPAKPDRTVKPFESPVTTQPIAMLGAAMQPQILVCQSSVESQDSTKDDPRLVHQDSAEKRRVKDLKAKPDPLVLEHIESEEQTVSPQYKVMDSPVTPEPRLLKRDYSEGGSLTPTSSPEHEIHIYPSPVTPPDSDSSPPKPQSPSSTCAECDDVLSDSYFSPPMLRKYDQAVNTPPIELPMIPDRTLAELELDRPIVVRRNGNPKGEPPPIPDKPPMRDGIRKPSVPPTPPKPNRVRVMVAQHSEDDSVSVKDRIAKFEIPSPPPLPVDEQITKPRRKLPSVPKEPIPTPLKRRTVPIPDRPSSQQEEIVFELQEITRLSRQMSEESSSSQASYGGESAMTSSSEPMVTETTDATEIPEMEVSVPKPPPRISPRLSLHTQKSDDLNDEDLEVANIITEAAEKEVKKIIAEAEQYVCLNSGHSERNVDYKAQSSLLTSSHHKPRKFPVEKDVSAILSEESTENDILIDSLSNIYDVPISAAMKSLKRRILNELKAATVRRRWQLEELEEIRSLERQIEQLKIARSQISAFERPTRSTNAPLQAVVTRRTPESLRSPIHELSWKGGIIGLQTVATHMGGSPQLPPRRPRHRRQTSDPSIVKFSPISEDKDIESDFQARMAERLDDRQDKYSTDDSSLSGLSDAESTRSEPLSAHYRKAKSATYTHTYYENEKSRSVERLPPYDSGSYSLPYIPLSASQSDPRLYEARGRLSYPCAQYLPDHDERYSKEERLYQLQIEIEKRKRQVEETQRVQLELLRMDSGARVRNANDYDMQRQYHASPPRQTRTIPVGIIRPLDDEYYKGDLFTQQEYATYLHDNLYKPTPESSSYAPPTRNAYSSSEYLAHKQEEYQRRQDAYFDDFTQRRDELDDYIYRSSKYQDWSASEPKLDQFPPEPNATTGNHDSGVSSSNTLPDIYSFRSDLDFVPTKENHTPRVPHHSDAGNSPAAERTPAMPLLDDITTRSRKILHSIGSRPNSAEFNFPGGIEDLLSAMHRAESDNSVDADEPIMKHVMEGGVTILKQLDRKKQPAPSKPRKYSFATKRILLTRDPREKSNRGNGIGMKIVGGLLFPGTEELVSYVQAIYPGGVAGQLHGELQEGDQILEWNGVSLSGKTYEDVQLIISQQNGEIELLIRPGTNLTAKQAIGGTFSLDQYSPHSSYDNLDDGTDDMDEFDRCLAEARGVDANQLAAQLQGMQADNRPSPATSHSSSQQDFRASTISSPGSSTPRSEHASTSSDHREARGKHRGSDSEYREQRSFRQSNGNNSGSQTSREQYLRQSDQDYHQNRSHHSQRAGSKGTDADRRSQRSGSQSSETDRRDSRNSNKTLDQVEAIDRRSSSGSGARGSDPDIREHKSQFRSSQSCSPRHRSKTASPADSQQQKHQLAESSPGEQSPGRKSSTPPVNETRNRHLKGSPIPGHREPKNRQKDKTTTSTESRISISPMGDVQLQLSHDDFDNTLNVHIIQARGLLPKDINGLSDPFVKLYLLPGRTIDNKRRTKYIPRTLNPEWHQTAVFQNIHREELRNKVLEFTVWDYDRFKANDFLGEVILDLSEDRYLDNKPHWYPLHPHTQNPGALLPKSSAAQANPNKGSVPNISSASRKASEPSNALTAPGGDDEVRRRSMGNLHDVENEASSDVSLTTSSPSLRPQSREHDVIYLDRF